MVARCEYDGLGRRIVKKIKNSADWDNTYHYYWDGQQMVETRNGLDQVLKQHVWGRQYVDELVQIAMNQDPENADRNRRKRRDMRVKGSVPETLWEGIPWG